MTPQVHLVVGDDHEVEGARSDRVRAAGAEIFLDRLIGLDRGHREAESGFAHE
jgi:hypothetical protein